MASLQFNAVQMTPAVVSVTGVNFSLVSVEGNGVQNALLSMTGNDVSQAIRAFHTTSKSGGYARLGASLQAVDRVVSLFHCKQSKASSPEPGWCTAVLSKLIVRGKCTGFGRTRGPLKAIIFDPPQGLGVATRRVLAIGALWVEIIGSKELDKFILQCVKKVAPNIPDELQQELSRMCTHLSDDLTLAGLGIVHNGEELMGIIGDYVKSELGKSSSQGQLVRSELVDLLWTFHADASTATPGRYWTNDTLVFFIYTVLQRLSPNIPELDFNPNLPRHQLEKTLLKYGTNRTYSPGAMDPWLVRCSNEEFWELMWLYNRPGDGSLSEYQYLSKVKKMQDMLVKYTKLSPRHTEDKGLCTLVSFDSTRVPVTDTAMHRRVEKACVKVLREDFAQFARVATAVEFFDEKELNASETLGRMFGFGPFEPHGEEQVCRTLDLKYKTIALLVLQTIVMKSLADDQQRLILYTPALHTGVVRLKGVLRALSASGSCIQLWRIILVSAWFVGGQEINCNVRERRSDIKDCVGVMGARSTLMLAGVINGSDDSVANNKLWVCNGPVPDLPNTNCGLILVDSTHEIMSSWGLNDTFDQDVIRTQADADIVIDVGPSYGNDEDKIRSWIRTDGHSVGFFNPLVAMSRILTNVVECKCISKKRIPESGAYHGWPVKMSELVQKPDQFNFQVSDGSTRKLIFLVHKDKIWRYCLAGALGFDPVIAGDCECVLCTEEMISEMQPTVNVKYLIL